MDLQQVGRVLRDQRKARGIPRTRLAREVGVSPTYLWMLEEAKARDSGEPSRPSKYLLSDLAEKLGMSRRQADSLLELAGYGETVDEPSQDLAPTVLDRAAVPREYRHPSKLGSEALASLLEEVRELLPHAVSLSVPLGSEFRISGLWPYAPQDQLADVLDVMEDQDFSQVIVRDNSSLRLMTLAGVAHWLSKRGEKGAISLSHTTVGDVLQVEGLGRHRILSAQDTVLDAVIAFKETPNLYAIILTETGDESEPPIGIVTPWDLVEFGSMVQAELNGTTDPTKV